jgi:hypothetical protein
MAAMLGLPLACCAACAAFVAAPCLAQTEDDGPFHWAYGTALGSGIYLLGDGTETQTYRGNFSVSLRAAENDLAGVRLLLPASLGVENTDDDIRPLEQGSPDVVHAGFLPGVELEHYLGERWTLRSRAQAGYAEELEGTEQSARLAAVGLRSRVTFDDAPGRPALISGFLWTGFDSSVGERDSMLRLTAGLELDFRAPRWRFRDSPMSWRPHVLKDWYYRPPPALAYGDGDAELLEDEWQLGVAAAREEGFKILFFEFDAVGVAYRFSEHGQGLRFYLNSVF